MVRKLKKKKAKVKKTPKPLCTLKNHVRRSSKKARKRERSALRKLQKQMLMTVGDNAINLINVPVSNKETPVGMPSSLSEAEKTDDRDLNNEDDSSSSFDSPGFYVRTTTTTNSDDVEQSFLSLSGVSETENVNNIPSDDEDDRGSISFHLRQTDVLVEDDPILQESNDLITHETVTSFSSSSSEDTRRSLNLTPSDITVNNSKVEQALKDVGNHTPLSKKRRRTDSESTVEIQVNLSQEKKKKKRRKSQTKDNNQSIHSIVSQKNVQVSVIDFVKFPEKAGVANNMKNLQQQVNDDEQNVNLVNEENKIQSQGKPGSTKGRIKENQMKPVKRNPVKSTKKSQKEFSETIVLKELRVHLIDCVKFPEAAFSLKKSKSHHRRGKKQEKVRVHSQKVNDDDEMSFETVKDQSVLVVRDLATKDKADAEVVIIDSDFEYDADNSSQQSGVKTLVTSCDYCDFTCKEQIDLEVHIAVHHAKIKEGIVTLEESLNSLKESQVNGTGRAIRQRPRYTPKKKPSLPTRSTPSSESDVFTCHICRKEFGSARGLKSHARSHLHECHFCLATFGSIKAFEKHINQNHPEVNT